MTVFVLVPTQKDNPMACVAFVLIMSLIGSIVFTAIYFTTPDDNPNKNMTFFPLMMACIGVFGTVCCCMFLVWCWLNEFVQNCWRRSNYSHV